MIKYDKYVRFYINSIYFNLILFYFLSDLKLHEITFELNYIRNKVIFKTEFDWFYSKFTLISNLQ
jgi:hypothetical protein